MGGKRETKEPMLALEKRLRSLPAVSNRPHDLGGCGVQDVLWRRHTVFESGAEEAWKASASVILPAEGRRGSGSEDEGGRRFRRGVRKGRPSIPSARRGDHNRHARAEPHV